MSGAPMLKATALHVAVAAVAMGSWAAFANAGAGAAAMTRAALAQAAISGGITLGLKRALEAMGAAWRDPLALVLPPLVTCAVTLAVLVGVHTAAGTANLWRTIALPYAVSSTYAWGYSLALFRARAASREGAA